VNDKREPAKRATAGAMDLSPASAGLRLSLTSDLGLPLAKPRSTPGFMLSPASRA
jgi:hypothetical protein